MAINLIDKMHEMYLCDRVTIDITKTLDIILQEQEKNLTDIEKQNLLNYATWFLENIEKDLGIAEKEITEKSRRNTVRQRLLTRSKVTLKGIKQICSDYLNNYNVEYMPKKYIVHIIYGEITEEKLRKLQKMLRAYIPAHILITYSNYARTHKELSSFTHTKLSSFTHQELREKDSLE